MLPITVILSISMVIIRIKLRITAKSKESTWQRVNEVQLT